jgi:hypothetical protein
MILGASSIPNILFAATLALPISGPNYYDCPASKAPNIIAKIAMKILIEYVIPSVVLKA